MRPLRIRAAMKHFKCDTPAELAAKSDAELLAFPNFGRTSVRQLRAMTKGEGENKKMMTPMNLNNFINRVRGLFNIDGMLLADTLSREQQSEFCRDPVHYLINKADKPQLESIWRELQKRATPWDIAMEKSK
jgi:Bacterial RNA polymerase, alpha chain C terminal domain